MKALTTRFQALVNMALLVNEESVKANGGRDVASSLSRALYKKLLYNAAMTSIHTEGKTFVCTMQESVFDDWTLAIDLYFTPLKGDRVKVQILDREEYPDEPEANRDLLSYWGILKMDELEDLIKGLQ